MHRVELKGLNAWFIGAPLSLVPNAPCGVESPQDPHGTLFNLPFLMHRVELKAACFNLNKASSNGS